MLQVALFFFSFCISSVISQQVGGPPIERSKAVASGTQPGWISVQNWKGWHFNGPRCSPPHYRKSRLGKHTSWSEQLVLLHLIVNFRIFIYSQRSSQVCIQSPVSGVGKSQMGPCSGLIKGAPPSPKAGKFISKLLTSTVPLPCCLFLWLKRLAELQSEQTTRSAIRRHQRSERWRLKALVSKQQPVWCWGSQH